jgi:tetratricopeptide (TPR) repeat protein
MTPSETTLPAAELIRRTLSRRARVVDEQLLWLLDATRFGIEKPLSAFLARMPAGSRLIVYFAGHATKSEAGEVFLAARDFDSTRPKETGLNLTNLLKSLDAAGEPPGANPDLRTLGAADANRRVFLFDVQHGGQDRAWQPSAEELVEALKARQGTVSRTVSVIGNASRGQLDLRAGDAEVGLFAASIASAYQGKATRGDDQRVTPQNLFKYLRIEIPTAALRAGQEQVPVFFEPTPDRFSPDQRKALQELASQLQADRKLDDGFALSYHQATTLVPDQPDAHLIYALQLLQDRTRSKLALERFEQVVAKFPDHPSTVLAYHAVAWLHFRSQNYDRGLQNLAQAVSRAPGADHPYSRHLFAFAGQLSGFTRWAVADEKLQATRIPEVLEAVTGQGKLAQQLFRETWEAVRTSVQQRDQEIQQTTGSAERAALELQKKNINVYTTFDSAAAIAFLKELLESPQ